MAKNKVRTLIQHVDRQIRRANEQIDRANLSGARRILDRAAFDAANLIEAGGLTNSESNQIARSRNRIENARRRVQAKRDQIQEYKHRVRT